MLKMHVVWLNFNFVELEIFDKWRVPDESLHLQAGFSFFIILLRVLIVTKLQAVYGNMSFFLKLPTRSNYRLSHLFLDTRRL